MTRSLNAMVIAEKAGGLHGDAEIPIGSKHSLEISVSRSRDQYISIPRQFKTLGSVPIGTDCTFLPLSEAKQHEDYCPDSPFTPIIEHEIRFFKTDAAAQRMIDKERSILLETHCLSGEPRFREMQLEDWSSKRFKHIAPLLAKLSHVLDSSGFGGTLMTSRGANSAVRRARKSKDMYLFDILGQDKEVIASYSMDLSTSIIIAFRVASAIYRVRFVSLFAHPDRTTAADMALAAALRLIVLHKQGTDLSMVSRPYDDVFENEVVESVITSMNKADDELRLRCAACGFGATEPKDLKMCPCGGVRYCGSACQKAHWREHKASCTARLKTS